MDPYEISDKIHDVSLRLLSICFIEDHTKGYFFKSCTDGYVKRLVNSVLQRLIERTFIIRCRRSRLFRQRQFDGGEHIPSRDLLRCARELVAALRAFARLHKPRVL